MTNQFADVSTFQGAIDWASYCASRTTVIIRAHNGWSTDGTFTSNRTKAQQNRITALGMYQYVTSGKSVIAQANQFCDAIGRLAVNEFVMADLEDPAVEGGLAGALHTWCSIVEARLGGHAVIYTGDYLADALPPSVTGGRIRMLAAYSREPAHPYEIWQYTDHAVVPGISSPCDESRSVLAAVDILAGTRGGAIPTPKPLGHFGNYNPATFGWTVNPTASIVPFSYKGVLFPQGVHKLAAPWFAQLLDALTGKGLIPIPKAGQCWGFENRNVTGGGTKSFHAYGLALDLNAVDNPYSATGATLPHTIGDGANAVVRSYGGEWGGAWASPKDYMHIECHLSPADISTILQPPKGQDMPLSAADKKWLHDEMVAVDRGENISFPHNGRPVVLVVKENGKFTRPAALWNGFAHRVLSSPEWTAVQNLADIRQVTASEYDALIPAKTA